MTRTRATAPVLAAEFRVTPPATTATTAPSGGPPPVPGAKERAAERAAAAQAKRDAARAKRDEPQTEPAAPVPPSKPFKTLRERLEQAHAPRLLTGIAPLDELTGGGIQAGKLVVIGGAPEAGKTTLAAQIGRNVAACGVPVAYLELDDPGGVDTRNLMSVGIDRRRAEEPDPATIAEAEEKLVPFQVVNEDDEPVRDVFEQFDKLHPSCRVMLVVDSVQSCATGQGLDESARGRVDQVIGELKALARELDAFVVATSEVNRGAYRSRKPHEQTDPLAAFKESGGIEYGATVAMVLTNVAGEPDLIDVAVVKNRLGRRGVFRLRLDRERATFEPVDVVDQSNDDHVDAHILGLITTNPGRSGSQLSVLAGVKRSELFSSLDRLEKSGRIKNAGTTSRPKWSSSTEAEEATLSTSSHQFPSVPGTESQVISSQFPPVGRGTDLGNRSGKEEEADQFRNRSKGKPCRG